MKRPYTERFFDHIGQKTQHGCILWTAGCDKDGYGDLWCNNKPLRAHIELHMKSRMANHQTLFLSFTNAIILLVLILVISFLELMMKI